MLKAILLDMDDTLCDTIGANRQARMLMRDEVANRYGNALDGEAFASAYVAGIYREWTAGQRARYMPVIEREGEGAFRLQLIRDLLSAQGVRGVADAAVRALQDKFDRDRLESLAFFPGIAEFLLETRDRITSVVITNGPEFSQLPKIRAIGLERYVDHIIIGGREPEQKPASSIFHKALALANCAAGEAIHIGDSLAHDIAGAQGCGIAAVWVRHQQPIGDAGVVPEHVVSTAMEFPALIKELLGA